MNNQCLFEKYFLVSLSESVTTASAGVGAMGATTDSSDANYAPGETRIPYSIFGKVITRPMPKRKRRKRRSKKKKS